MEAPGELELRFGFCLQVSKVLACIEVQKVRPKSRR